MRSMRAQVGSVDDPGVLAKFAVLVSVTCWPTIGAKSESKARRNCSTCRRVGSPVGEAPPKAEPLKTVAFRKRKSVSVLPSCRKPKPRIWGPWNACVQRVVKGHVGHAEHPDLLIGVAQVRDLYDLRLVLKAPLSAGPEMTRRRGQVVTTLASETGRSPVHGGTRPIGERPDLRRSSSLRFGPRCASCRGRGSGSGGGRSAAQSP